MVAPSAAQTAAQHPSGSWRAGSKGSWKLERRTWLGTKRKPGTAGHGAASAKVKMASSAAAVQGLQARPRRWPAIPLPNWPELACSDQACSERHRLS